MKAVYQLLRQFHGLDPGLEFKVAMDECDASGARLVLGDRDQDATIRALRDAIDLADVLKLLAGGGGVDKTALDPELAALFSGADWRDPARAGDAQDPEGHRRDGRGDARAVSEGGARDARPAGRRDDRAPGNARAGREARRKSSPSSGWRTWTASRRGGGTRRETGGG